MKKQGGRNSGEAQENGVDGAGVDNDGRNVDEIARVIGIAAVKYTGLKNNCANNYRFSFDKMVKMEGDTAPIFLHFYELHSAPCQRQQQQQRV